MKLPPWPAMAAVAVLAVVTSGACAGWGDNEASMRPPTPEQLRCGALTTSTQRAMANLTHHRPLRQALIARAQDNDLPAVRGLLGQAGVPEREAAELPIQIKDTRRERSAPATRLWLGNSCSPERLVVNIFQ